MVSVAWFALFEKLCTGSLERKAIIWNTAKAYITFIVMNTS
jgi:hypothetical protein